MEKSKKYFLLGMFFLFIQLIVIIRNIASDYYNFFWFCDFIPLPLAIGFFLKKDNFIKSIINIGLLAQLVSVVLYLYKMFSGISTLEVIPDTTTLFYAVSSIFIHLSNTFALIFTYKIKPTIKTLFYSVIFLFAMYLMALFFTTPEQGINYTLSYGPFIPWVIPYYTELWVLFMFLLIVLPTQFIQYIIYKHYVHNLDDKTKSKLKHLGVVTL